MLCVQVLNYVALRLLGERAQVPHMQKALAFIRSNGGALYAPSWAKVSSAYVFGHMFRHIRWQHLQCIPTRLVASGSDGSTCNAYQLD